MANERSPAMFSSADGLAAGSGDLLVLIARVLIGSLFLTSGWGKLMNVAGAVGYLTNLGVPAPGLMAWVVLGVELLIGVTLIVGLAVRYSALLTFVFLVVATALAHRYWTYPAAAQTAQFAHFTKNIAIMGGALLLLWTGAGRYSIDNKMR